MSEAHICNIKNVSVSVIWHSDLYALWNGNTETRTDTIAIPVEHLERLRYSGIDLGELCEDLRSWADTKMEDYLKSLTIEEQRQRIIDLDDELWITRAKANWIKRCERNGLEDYVCAYCGKELSYLDHIDHVIPRSKGGANDPDNLVSSCYRCNQNKAAHTPEEANMPIKYGDANLLRTGWF
jgi:hypothetical protein